MPLVDRVQAVLDAAMALPGLRALLLANPVGFHMNAKGSRAEDASLLAHQAVTLHGAAEGTLGATRGRIRVVAESAEARVVLLGLTGGLVLVALCEPGADLVSALLGAAAALEAEIARPEPEP